LVTVGWSWLSLPVFAATHVYEEVYGQRLRRTVTLQTWTQQCICIFINPSKIYGGSIHNCLKNDAGITVGHLPQKITFYKINTDFNIVNLAKSDIKILVIKTHYAVIQNNQLKYIGMAIIKVFKCLEQLNIFLVATA